MSRFRLTRQASDSYPQVWNKTRTILPGSRLAGPALSPQSSRRAALNVSPSRLVNSRSPALPSGSAKLEQNLAGTGFRRRDDPRGVGGCRLPRGGDKNEFLVFPRHVGVLGQPVQARAGDAAGKMAPVGRVERAGRLVRARRQHMRAGLDQLRAHRQNALPAGRRARLDDQQRVGGQLPEPVDQFRQRCRRDLVQHIGAGDEVGRLEGRQGRW